MLFYYSTLGLQRCATTVEIKKAYHELALQWHPDKNPNNRLEAERRFRELSEAYEVLSNDNQRTMYDHYGQEMGVTQRETTFHSSGGGMTSGFASGGGMMSGFGSGISGFDSGITSSVSASSFGGTSCGGGGGSKSMSSSTKIVENGQERVEVEENGQLISLTINGMEQLHR
ncbi:hypothetical protein NHX12_010218 [Muraenolepis orangiensis]|uniref:J domain-containing protein n=1 Tax=Muraenolepis orangiensis TaxID=630683 RepID=A0A9Q0DJ59_9TELE|nr:hypothetical protein NHX12_010218 [Muraenolepis orangiensis]